MRLRWEFLAWVLAGVAAPLCGAQDQLAGNTVLIVRHAEKPLLGSGLTELGQGRARAYVQYFRPFREGGLRVTVTSLYAGADSEESRRPRLTLEPLSEASGLALDSSVGTKHGDELVEALRTHAHGKVPLVCWRHGQIPALLKAFGASPETLLPGGKWPDEMFDEVVVLTFDRAGKLASQRLVKESLRVE